MWTDSQEVCTPYHPVHHVDVARVVALRRRASLKRRHVTVPSQRAGAAAGPDDVDDTGLGVAARDRSGPFAVDVAEGTPHWSAVANPTRSIGLPAGDTDDTDAALAARDRPG